MKKTYHLFLYAVMSSIVALTGCGSPGGGGNNDDQQPSANLPKLMGSLTAITTGGINLCNIQLTDGSSPFCVTDATVKINLPDAGGIKHENVIPYDGSYGYYRKTTTGWSPSAFLTEGSTIDFSITRGSLNITASIQVPSALNVLSAPTLMNYPKNTDLTVTWDTVAAHYSYLPQYANLILFVSSPSCYTGGSTPFSNGTRTFTGSYFITSAARIGVFNGSINTASNLGADLDSGSALSIIYNNNALMGVVQ